MKITYRLLHEDVRHQGTQLLLNEPPTIMVSGEGDDWAWEFMVEGHVFEHRTGLEPQIELKIEPTRATRICMFSDAYRAFADIPAFFAAIGEASREITRLEVVKAALDALGAVDDTKRA